MLGLYLETLWLIFLQYVKYTKWINIAKELYNIRDK